MNLKFVKINEIKEKETFDLIFNYEFEFHENEEEKNYEIVKNFVNCSNCCKYWKIFVKKMLLT